MFDNITLEQFKQIKEQVIKNIKSKDKEIDEILDKLSNRKSETLIQGLRECQLKDIEHPFITKEEYIDKILNYIKDLQQKVEQLENENFNIRENIHLERISLPPELTKDKNFMELYDIPSYEDLKNKVEQLENIRKEAIKYVQEKADYPISYYHCLNGLLNILNKGDNNVKDKR